jgi:hypothetical protein
MLARNMTGKCYVNSYKLLKLLSDSLSKETDPAERLKLEGLCLVHGWVTPTSGEDKGKQIDHAWVEAASSFMKPRRGKLPPRKSKYLIKNFKQRRECDTRLRRHPA